MKIGITYRLFLALLAAALLSIATMLLIMHWNIDRGFLRYVNELDQIRQNRMVEKLAQTYATEGSWDSLRREPHRWRAMTVDSRPEDDHAMPPPPHEAHRHGDAPPEMGPPRRPTGRRFEARVFLLDADKNPVSGPPGGSEKVELKPVLHQGQVVGYLGLLPRKQLSDESQLRFLKQQKLTLAMIAGFVVLVAAGLSLPLANRLLRPVRSLAAATNRLAAGDFAIRVPVTSSDEMGHLARDFNALALTLEKNEQARRQWVADISHELRTPLAILRGEIESIQDGIRQPDAGSIGSLHGEVLRLTRLVDDLYQLSLSDLGALTYRKEELDPVQLLRSIIAPYYAEFAAKGIALEAAIPDCRSMMFGDPERLRQLFSNLLDNALKYTDGGGRLDIRLACSGGQVTIDFQDTAPGIPADELEKIFDRLYRVEASRNRGQGGAGLGLAICRNIAEAHEGRISAHPSPTGGLWISVSLPLTGNGK